jgi:hypothetical protein
MRLIQVAHSKPFAFSHGVSFGLALLALSVLRKRKAARPRALACD